VIGSQAIRLALFVVLARILEPADFGLIAMLTLFTGIAQVFVDAGFSAALIQKKEISPNDEKSVFALNVGVGCVLAIFLCAISPMVSGFYGQPVLVPLLCVNSLVIVIASLSMVQAALFTRDMLFKKMTLISISGMAFAGGISVAMALFGFGVWSLLGLSLSEALLRTAMLWKMSAWKPQGTIQFGNILSMWKFSSRLLICNLISTFQVNIFAVIIGKVYSAEQLGYFNRANQLRMLPVNVLTGMTGKVSFPLFSRVQDDKPRLLGQLREIVRSTVMLSAGGMILLAVLADPLIPYVLTEKWRPAVPLLRILCVASITLPIHVLYLMVLQAQGLSHLNMRLEIIKLVAMAIVTGLAYRHGVTVLALCLVALAVFSYFVNAWYNVRLLDYSWLKQAYDILPPVLLCTISGGVAWWIGGGVTGKLIVLLAQTSSFFLCAFLGIYLLRKVCFENVWANIGWLFLQAIDLSRSVRK